MASVPKFEPAKLRPRHDGWSAERQIGFVQAIAEGATIDSAARRVGMTRDSAYKLRRRPCGMSFRNGWDAAIDCNMPELEQAAIERSKNGVVRPIFYKGEQVGEWRHFDERLTMFLLRFRRRHRFGPEADSLPRSSHMIPRYDVDEQLPFDPEEELDGHLDSIEFAPEPADDDEPESGEEPGSASDSGEL